MGLKQKEFWFYVDRGEPDECWEFMGGKTHDGYGRYRVGKEIQMAHRISWIELVGPIPNDMFVLHKCDNPSCCNPAHLFLGTHDDNMKDMIEKGRSRRKTSDEDRENIRNLYRAGISQPEIARRFNIAYSNVNRIIQEGQ